MERSSVTRPPEKTLRRCGNTDEALVVWRCFADEGNHQPRTLLCGLEQRGSDFGMAIPTKFSNSSGGFLQKAASEMAAIMSLGCYR